MSAWTDERASSLAASRSLGRADQDHAPRPLRHARYTPRELYSVVANVPSYAAFVPFCTGSEIVSATGGGPPKISATEPFDVDAELRIGFMNFSEGYVSKVKARPYDSVEVGPLGEPHENVEPHRSPTVP